MIWAGCGPWLINPESWCNGDFGHRSEIKKGCRSFKLFIFAVGTIFRQWLSFHFPWIQHFYYLNESNLKPKGRAESIDHRNMNSIEGATLLTMQRPKNSQKKKTWYKEISPAYTGRKRRDGLKIKYSIRGEKNNADGLIK